MNTKLYKNYHEPLDAMPESIMYKGSGYFCNEESLKKISANIENFDTLRKNYCFYLSKEGDFIGKISYKYSDLEDQPDYYLFDTIDEAREWLFSEIETLYANTKELKKYYNKLIEK